MNLWRPEQTVRIIAEAVARLDIKEGVQDLDLPGDFALVVQIEVDDIDAVTQINECDCWGKVAWEERGRSGWSLRPAGFDGQAHKLHPRGWHIDSNIWWQPPGSDVIGDTPWTSDELAEAKANVTRLLANGFLRVGVGDRWLSGIDADLNSEDGESYIRDELGCLAYDALACGGADRIDYIIYADACDEAGVEPYPIALWRFAGCPIGPLEVPT